MKRPTPVEHEPARVAHDASAQNDGTPARADRRDVLYGLADGDDARGASTAVVFLPNPKPANDEALDLPSDDEIAQMLAEDPEFADVCAERRARWIDSRELAAAATAHDDNDEESDDDAAAPPHAEGRTPR